MNLFIVRRCLILVSLLASAGIAIQAQSQGSRLDLKVEVFDSDQSSSLDQLIELGKRFHIPMGIEWSYKANEKVAAPIHLVDVAVSEIVKQILKQQPGYDFEERWGIVHIYDRSLLIDKANFLNLRLPEFRVTDENLFGVTFNLRVSIKQMLHPTPGYGGGHGYGPGRADGFDVLKVSIKGKDISVREVLSQAVVKQDNALWLLILHPEETMAGEPFYGQGYERARNSVAPHFNWDFIALNDHLIK
jgi:hypothetical protein